jgi:signal transduction histidine kinase
MSVLNQLSKIFLEPSTALDDLFKKRKARLLSVFLLMMFALFFSLNIAYYIFVPDYETATSDLIGYCFLLVAYLGSRTRYFKAAAGIVVIMFPVVVFSQVLDGTSINPAVTLCYLIMQLLLASILLSVWVTAGLALLNIIGILLMPIFAPHSIPEVADILGTLAINIIGAALILVSMYYRASLEKDIDQRAAQLRRQTAELEATNRELEAFSYSVSHDLRAPLRAINGFSEALLEETGNEINEKAEEYLTRIRDAGQRMNALIESLLGLAKLTRHKINREQTDLSDLARTIFDELHASAPERKADFICEGDLTAWVDQHLFRIALENIIGNAWKYTSKRDNTVIRFGSQHNGKTVFFIGDNGTGFDMKYSHKLFVPFQRLHHREEYAGSGIGLATVQRIIHRHSGKIWAEAETDKGAIFYFTV